MKTKKDYIEYINGKIDWFLRMQRPLGNSSWWYSNRSSDDCINVKIYSGVDLDELLASLPKKTKKIIDKLNLKIEEWVENEVWGDFGLIQQAGDELEEELKNSFNVTGVEYAGSSGGWLCVIYEWNEIPGDYDSGEYTTEELKEFKRVLDDAEKENVEVISLVLTRKKELDKIVADVNSYRENLIGWVDETLEIKQEEAKKILSI